MSSEFEDSDAALQQELQRSAPNGPNGPPLGSPAAPAPDVAAPGPVAANPAPGPNDANVGPPAAPVAAWLAGEPGTLPPVWCKKCQANVVPEGKGRCPRCQTFLRLNFAARRHPVNKLRKQQLLDQLVADYRPSTTMLLATCEHLAGILEQLEVMKPGSPDHQRLVQLSQLLGTALEATRATRDAAPSIAALSTDELIERTTEMLHELLRAKDFEAAPCHPNGADGGPDSDANAGPPVRIVAPTREEGTKSTPAPAPEPCPYCHQRPCVGPEHHAYDVLHWNDPIEVKKRDDLATREMFAMVGRRPSAQEQAREEHRELLRGRQE